MTTCLRISQKKGIDGFRENIVNNAAYYRKRILYAICILMTVAIGIGFFMAFCQGEVLSYDAEYNIVYPDAEYPVPTGLLKVVISWVLDIASGGLAEYVGNMLNVQYSMGAIKMGNDVINFTLVSAIFNLTKNLAVMLCIIWFGTGLLEEFSFQQVYVEKMVKKFVFFLITIILINNAQDIVFGLANVGTAVLQRLVKAVTEGDAADANRAACLNLAQTIWDECSVAEHHGKIKVFIQDFVPNVGKCLSYILMMLFPWITSLVCMLIVKVCCWTRVFKIFLTAMFAPISMSDIARGELERSGALKMLKSVLALALSGTMMFAICLLTGEVITSYISKALNSAANFGSGMWNITLISIVRVGLVLKSEDLCKTALGLN